MKLIVIFLIGLIVFSGCISVTEATAFCEKYNMEYDFVPMLKQQAYCIDTNKVAHPIGCGKHTGCFFEGETQERK